MGRRKSDDVLVGLVMAERMLAERHPRYAMSRHQLRRLCIGRVVPCSALPSGCQVRYLVRVADVVASLMAREQLARSI